MLEFTTRPLSDKTWLARRARRKSAFAVTWVQTLDLLERELGLLKAKDVVLEVDLRLDQIRNDGRPRGDAKASSPAVILAYESKHGQMMHRCDTYVRGPSMVWRSGKHVQKMPDDWMHNVRAIALTLSALRDVDRHGAADTGQQYTGFKAIGAGTAMPASHMTYDEAKQIVAAASGITMVAGAVEGPAMQAAMKQAKIRSHPDQNGGERGQWNLVEQAVMTINRRHGW